MSEQQDTEDTEYVEVTRRQLAGGAAAAVAGSLGLSVAMGKARAQVGSPSGTVGSASSPYLHIYMERAVFVERSSAISSVPSGSAALYIRGDL